MTTFGYKPSNGDQTLFIKHQDKKVTILIVYVDYIIITKDNLEEISKLEKNIAREFGMKEPGPLRYVFGNRSCKVRERY